MPTSSRQDDPAYLLLDQPPRAETAFAALAPALAGWFRRRFGEPTEVQRLAWPALAEGRHLLLSAPTGTGKTLAAFLPVLSRLLANPPPTVSPLGDSSPLRCLYVSPLKALDNDAARNLQRYLAEIADHLPAGVPVPRLGVRTGDTRAEERRRLLDDPPDVLLTTPESLAVLLSQPRWLHAFANLRWAVVDEVHALAGSKRGADLALSLERLSAFASSRWSFGPDAPPEVRRVGLSATATPLAEAARFLAGAGRPCAIARAGHGPPPELELAPLPEGRRFLTSLVERVVPELRKHRATLIFTNARGLAERLAWALRRREPGWDAQVAVHHSALSAGRRREVEEQFKEGRLRAVVSSTSLELGIDVGPVDCVVLVHPPGDVVRLLQRVGRSGHGPRGVRRGLVLTASPAELLEAAVTAASGQAAQCEPLRVPDCPLDVLCQQLLGMAATRSWPPEEAYELVRRATPFAGLSRTDFDDCLAYLRGLGRDGKPWLPARLRDDGDCFRIRDARTARLLRRNLGTILEEESVPVVLRTDAGPSSPLSPEAGERGEEDPRSSGGFHVGEVDEAFADRLEPGDRFLLDGRCLEYRTREEGALWVEEVAGRPQVPRWAGEGWPLSAELARRVYALRVGAGEALREGSDALATLLRRDYALEGPAAEALGDFFVRQECVSEVPDGEGVLVEVVAHPGVVEYAVHTPLNRAGNDALARVAVARLARDLGRSATSVVADLGFLLRVRGGLPGEAPEGLRRLLAPGGFAEDLAGALAESVALRERFRRVALTGLMMLRNPLGGRRRVGGRGWGERRLFEQVRGHDPDFVLLRQAAREVRSELCDGAAALAFAEELPRRGVRCRWLARPSPFVAAWTQAGAGPAESAETPAEALRRLHARLMAEGDG